MHFSVVAGYNRYMSKARILLILGIWVAILPYLGFPNLFKKLLFTLTGLALVYFSFLLYKMYKKENNIQQKTFENFSENREFVKDDNPV